MPTTCLGNHAKILARPSDQERIRSFYQDVLGGRLTKESPAVDYIKLGEDFFLAVLYQDTAPGPEDLRHSIWLELRSEDPETLRQRIIAFGVTTIETPDAAHLYFHAPGGQVFRLVRTGEDLSRFEK